MKRGLLPSYLVIRGGRIPENFGKRLEAFKIKTGLSWDNLAAWIGVDPRQLQRWRKGTKPSGDGLWALIVLAAHIPGGVYTLFQVRVAPPVDPFRPNPASGFGLTRDSREA